MGGAPHRIPSRATSPQKEIKSSFSSALICTTRRRIPASASTNHGPEKGLYGLYNYMDGSAPSVGENLEPLYCQLIQVLSTYAGGDDWGCVHGAGRRAECLPSLRGCRKGLVLPQS